MQPFKEEKGKLKLFLVTFNKLLQNLLIKSDLCYYID